MTRRPLFVFAAAFSLGVLATTADAAEPPSSGGAPTAGASGGTSPGPTTENRAVAEMLFFTARGLMEAGRYAEACTKLAESYRLDAASGTLLNLAVCHASEGRVASAWGEFRQALSDARKANRLDREELAKEHIAKLEPELPFLTIVVPEAVKVRDMEILRNGVALGSGGWSTELPIDPGKVEITARAPGFLPKTKTVTIQKKQHLSVTIEKLDPAPVTERIAIVEPGWSTKRKIGAGLFVAGLAGAGIGTYFGLKAMSQNDDANDLANCPFLDGERRCYDTGAKSSSNANLSAWGSNIAFGLGAVALLSGTYLFITGKNTDEPGASPNPQQGALSRIRFSVSPTVGGASGAVFGSF